MVLARHLLKTADGLLSETATQTMGRRAVSTAYYAVFHALAHICAEQLLTNETNTESDDYVKVYRALDHGSMKNAFKGAPLKELESIQSIGNRTVELQSERVLADYMPHKSRMYTRQQCLDLVQSARLTVEAIGRLHEADKRALAVNLIFKNRPQ